MSTVDDLALMFNNKLFDFLDDLRPVIGTLPEYGMLSSSARLLSHLNPGQNRAVFDAIVASAYGDRIALRDETFFLDTAYAEVSSSTTPNIVNLLKRVWLELTVEDKVAVWEHLNVLVALNARWKTLSGAA